MSLTPQFNGYVMAASIYEAATIPAGCTLQDHKSFSDYNFPANSGSIYRDWQRSPFRWIWDRQQKRLRQSQADTGYSANRFGPRQRNDRNVRYTGQLLLAVDVCRDFDSIASLP